MLDYDTSSRFSVRKLAIPSFPEGGYKNTAHIARMPGLVVLPGSGHGRSRSDFPEAFSTATMNPILSDLANFPPFFFYLG